MRVLLWVLGGLVALGALAFVALAVWVRVAPQDATAWHVDPMVVEKAATPNNWLVRPEGGDAAAPVYAADPEALMRALDAHALAQPRTQRIAGSPEELRATYVQRSALMAYPDYVSVRAIPAEGGATLAIYSRARFGQSDFGVNAERVSAWLEALRPLEE